MQEFHGDLLIGGMALRQLHGELEQEQPQEESGDWMLAGHLHLSPQQKALLDLHRPYRLQLDDGRAGQVVVSRIAAETEQELLVDFEPKAATAR